MASACWNGESDMYISGRVTVHACTCMCREKHKMELEEEGLLDKARDIQMMRVTRDLLQRLHERDLFSKDIREKETLENTTEFYKKVPQPSLPPSSASLHQWYMQAHKKSLRENSAVLKDISRQVKAKNAENRELDLKLRELQVSVAERAQIEKLAGEESLLLPAWGLMLSIARCGSI